MGKEFHLGHQLLTEPSSRLWSSARRLLVRSALLAPRVNDLLLCAVEALRPDGRCSSLAILGELPDSAWGSQVQITMFAKVIPRPANLVLPLRLGCNYFDQ